MRFFSFSFIILGLSLLLITGAAQNEKASHTKSGGENWRAFEFSDVVGQRARSDRPYLRFLDKPSMSRGLYALKAGQKDGQSAHKLDEVYYIVKRRATC